MTAWKRDQGLGASKMIEFFADTQSEATKALGLELTHPGPGSVLGAQTKRCKRSAMYVDNGVIKAMEISEAPDDPAGDAYPDLSCVEHMLGLVKGL
jgi:peroxiredoxin